MLPYSKLFRASVLAAGLVGCATKLYAQSARRARFNCQVVLVAPSAWTSGSERSTIRLDSLGRNPQILLKHGEASADDLIDAVHTLLLTRQLGKAMPSRRSVIRTPNGARSVSKEMRYGESGRAAEFLVRLARVPVTLVPGVGPGRAASLFLPRRIGVADVRRRAN